jgi:hypothetical protein
MSASTRFGFGSSKPYCSTGRVPKANVEATSVVLREAIARPELSVAFALAGATPASSLPSTLSARIISEQQYWQAAIVCFETSNRVGLTAAQCRRRVLADSITSP